MADFEVLSAPLGAAIGAGATPGKRELQRAPGGHEAVFIFARALLRPNAEQMPRVCVCVCVCVCQTPPPRVRGMAHVK